MSHEELVIDRTDKADGRIAVFALRGSLDLSSARAVREAVAHVADEREVVVDLRGVEFIDSTGLGALIGAHKRVVEHGHTLRVVLSEGTIERLLTITGLARIFALYRSVDDAVAGRDRRGGS
jgi:anti-sigma B factor antagonist